MASFFALEIAQFPKDNNGNTKWPLGRVSGLLCESFDSLDYSLNHSLNTDSWDLLRRIPYLTVRGVQDCIIYKPVENSPRDLSPKAVFVAGTMGSLYSYFGSPKARLRLV